jgi:hypothetical protein
MSNICCEAFFPALRQLERAGQVTVEAKGLLAVFEGTQEINFTVQDILQRQRNQALN